ncbi:putative Zn-dependent peptidase [Gillisia sp. Hel_I_86]|uniref:M16 family metallopeptidase n=1 Tax=Gillisia sp. Hel_I_86 TaxID=1249981 RepID=UPI00119C35A8|nr:pitrilysin family protein [Gillisia sp. Hel_I_86]TVZ26500.1 putative Zn-dependent peptidase [Gillisia sp. Hel_I_86]
MKTNIFTMLLICLMTTSAIAQIDRSKQPEPGPAPSIDLGEPETFQLKNGLRVLVVENHKLPRVTANLIIDNKPHTEKDKPATSSLVSALLGSGTQKMSKDAFNEEVDFLGATIYFGSESVSARALSKFFPRIIELMADGSLNPKFDQKEFDSEKTKLIESLKSNEKNVGAVANRVSSALAYGKRHPYGEFSTVENTEAVTLKDVETYYNTYFAPKNAYLVIIGDVKTSEVKEQVKKEFGKWNRVAPKDQQLPEVANVSLTEINFVDMPNAVQSELKVQNTINLKMNDEDYFAALVANQILGGSFGSYLNMNLREGKGYTYGARTSTGADKYASRFIASASVRNAVTDSAVVETMKEINRIKSELVDPQTLKDAKSQFAGDFITRLERPETIANYALDIQTNDLPKDFYENYLKNINAVTAEDVKRVANKYYNTDNMRIVIAGKGADVAANLEKVKLNGVKVPVKYYNSYGEEIDRPEFNKAVDASVTPKSIFDKYIKAIGGKEAVSTAESVYMVAQADIQGQKLDLEVKTAKGKSSQKISMSGNVLSKQVYNGATGFTMAQGQKIDFTEEQLMAAKADANPFPELDTKDAKVMGIEPVDGKDAYAVALTEDKTAYYDVESGLKVKEVSKVSQGDQTMEVPITYSDYQEVNGIKFPFSISQSMGPQTFDFKVQTLKVNEGVTDEDFME